MSADVGNPYDLIAADLRTLAGEEGAELWRDRHRLTGLLLDHQPELRREIRTVVAAAEQGVPQALADCDRSLAGIVIDRQAAQMELEAGLRAEVAHNVVRAIAHALDLGPLPGVYLQGGQPPRSASHQAMPPQPVSAPTAHSGWHDPYSSQPRTAGRKFLWPAVILGSALAVGAAILVLPQLIRAPAPEAAAVTATRPPANAERGYAGELIDLRVPPQSTLQANVNSPTPVEIPAGRRVTTQELSGLIAADPNLLLIDVLDGQHGRTLAGGHWIPALGRAGTFTDEHQVNGKTAIDALAGGDTGRALVFYCMGPSCWESYNATLRAAAMGYTNLYWYRGGLQAWEDAGLPMQILGAALGGG